MGKNSGSNIICLILAAVLALWFFELVIVTSFLGQLDLLGFNNLSLYGL